MLSCVFPDCTYLSCVTFLQAIEEFKDEMVPEKDERYQQVKTIVRHLIACNSDVPEVAKIEWTLHVVDKPIINAFVLPVRYTELPFIISEGFGARCLM